MWWRRTGLLLSLLALAACGFQPLYGERADGGAGRLAVEVAPIADRPGQVMRAALRRAFADDRVPEYRMNVTLSETVSVLAIDKRGDVIRRGMIVSAKWRMARLDAAPETPPLTGTVRVQEAYNVLVSDYANLAAERAARERAAERLAHLVAESATARAGGVR